MGLRSIRRVTFSGSRIVIGTAGAASGSPNSGTTGESESTRRSGRASRLVPVYTVSVTGSGAGQITGQ